MLLDVRSNSICQVSFSEAALLRRVRDRKRAAVGNSREHPRAPAGATVAAAGVGVLLGVTADAGALPSSWCSALSERVVSLPPGTQRFSRSSFCRKMASE